MDPNHVSEDDDSDKDHKKQDTYKSSLGPKFNRRRDYPSKEPWSGTSTSTSTSQPPAKNYEFTPRSNSFSNKTEETLRDQGRDTIVQQPPPIVIKKNEESPSTKDIIIPETTPEVSETDKMWHYKDPSGKIQGTFLMAQLRKWNNSKFFPVDLKIWKKSEKEDDGVLLTDALEGRFNKWAPKHDERDGFGNLPSPTPNQSGSSLFRGRDEGLQSPTPSGPRVAAAFGGGNNMPPQIVQHVVDQNLPYWTDGALQPSPSSNVVGQTFDQWGGVVQNPAGNFLPPPPPPPAQMNLPPQQPTVSWQPPGNQNMNWGTNDN